MEIDIKKKMKTSIKGRKKIISLVAILVYLLVYMPIYASDPVIITLEPHRFYFQPDTDHELTFQAYNIGIDANDLAYTIYDLYGNVVLQDTAVTDDNVHVTATVNLRQGYFRLYFQDLETYFGLSVLPLKEQEPDQFFAVHASLTKNDDLHLLSSQDKYVRHENLIKALNKNGIGLVRERLRPGVFHPSPDVFEYQGTSHRYDDARVLFEKYDVDVMGFFALTPWWMRREQDRVNPTERHNRFPANMHAITECWDSIAHRWGAVLKKIEVWNEPRSGTADRLAPLVHSIAYTFDGQEYPKIVGSAITLGTMQKHNQDLGYMKCFDAIDDYSFHQYTDADVTKNITELVRGSLQEFGHTGKPVINSESGEQYVGGTYPTFEQDVISGKLTVSKVVENKVFGMKHFFNFVYDPEIREEYAKQRSVICVSGTPSLNFASYVNLIHLISHRDYIGDLFENHPDIRYSRVLADQDTAVVCLYRNSGSMIDLPVTPLAIYGMDGRELDLEDGKLSLTDPMVYAVFNRSDIESHLYTETEAMNYYQMAQQSSQNQKKTFPVSVIHVPDYTELEFTNSAYIMNSILEQSASLNYEAYNLSGSEQTIDVSLQLPPWLVTSEDTMKSMTVPAGDKTRFSWQVDFNEDSQGFIGEVKLIPTGGSKDITHPLLFRVQCERPLEEILGSFKSYRKLNVYNQSKWREYGTNQAEIDINVEADTVKFQMVVSDEKDWMAGTYNVSDIDFSKVKGFFVDARIDKKPSYGSRFWPLMKYGFMESGDGGQYFGKEFPLDGKRRWVYAELDDIPIDLNDENQNLDRDQIVDFRARFRLGRPGVPVNAELYSVYLVSDSLMFGDTAFDVSIKVIDQLTGQPLQHASVTINEDILQSNDKGEVFLSQQPYGYYNILVERDGYFNVKDQIELIKDTAIAVELMKDNPDVSIYIENGITREPVAGANITWNDEGYSVTGSQGQLILSDFPADTMLFSINHSDYFPLTDTLVISSDTSINISLMPNKADVTFEIRDDEGPVNGAVIALNDFVVTTNPAGKADYYNQAARTTYHYEISADGYETVVDSFFLETDTSLTVLLDASTSAGFPGMNGVYCYPNPASDVLHIELNAPLSDPGGLVLHDILGNVVYQSDAINTVYRIKTGHLKHGLYYVSINVNGSNIHKKIIIRR